VQSFAAVRIGIRDRVSQMPTPFRTFGENDTLAIDHDRARREQIYFDVPDMEVASQNGS